MILLPTDVFKALGETAYKTESPLCFFIDEIQYMKPEELGALIASNGFCISDLNFSAVLI